MNIAQSIKSLVFGQVPNYAIVYVDGRCNMHCSFVVMQWMQNNSNIMPADWCKELSLLHLTITGGEPFFRKDLTEIISEIIQNSGVQE